MFKRKPIITFLCDDKYKGAIPDPIPASKATPKWYRKMTHDVDDSGMLGTIKRCLPFKDAMDMGYIIPLWTDIKVSHTEGSLDLSYKHEVLNPTFGDHLYEQIRGCPVAETTYGRNPMKLYNPWVIKTPPGWSCMFIQPINHFDSKFNIITGVVDTDKYFSHVQLPFLWSDNKFEGVIHAGTPLVQIIPFKRMEWTSEITTLGPKGWDLVHATMNSVNLVIHNAYRFKFWTPKNYK
jgi:hypothetical protein